MELFHLQSLVNVPYLQKMATEKAQPWENEYAAVLKAVVAASQATIKVFILLFLQIFSLLVAPKTKSAKLLEKHPLRKNK